MAKKRKWKQYRHVQAATEAQKSFLKCLGANPDDLVLMTSAEASELIDRLKNAPKLVTDAQRSFLLVLGMPPDDIDDLTKAQAGIEIDHLLKQRKAAEKPPEK